MALRWNGRDVGIFPALKSEVDRTFRALPGSYVVVSGDRTNAEQDALWFQGRDAEGHVIDPTQIVTNTRDSAHEYGAALDFAVVNADGSIDWSGTSPAYVAAINAVRANPNLKTGADIVLANGATDPGHIELKNWRKLIPPIVADATRTNTGGAGASWAGGEGFPIVAPPPNADDAWFELDPGILIAGALVIGAGVVLLASLEGGGSRAPRLARARS